MSRWRIDNCKIDNSASGIKAEFRPAALRIRLHLAAMLLRRRFESAESADFIEDSLGIELVLQALQRSIDRLTFSDNDFWHLISPL